MRATAARRTPPIGDLTKRTFPHGRVRVLSLRRPLEEDISLGQDRAVPASAWRKEMTYLPVCPPSSLRGNRTARPDHRSGFPCRAGHEEEGRITLGNNIKSPRLYRDRHSTTPAYLGWQAARAQKCCALWCYPTPRGVVFSDSRRLFPPREPWEAEQCVDAQPRTRGGRTAYWCQRVVGPPSLNYTPKGDPR